MVGFKLNEIKVDLMPLKVFFLLSLTFQNLKHSKEGFIRQITSRERWRWGWGRKVEYGMVIFDAFVKHVWLDPSTETRRRRMKQAMEALRKEPGKMRKCEATPPVMNMCWVYIFVRPPYMCADSLCRYETASLYRHRILKIKGNWEFYLEARTSGSEMWR
jgi:hypothetical protein